MCFNELIQKKATNVQEIYDKTIAEKFIAVIIKKSVVQARIDM